MHGLTCKKPFRHLIEHGQEKLKEEKMNSIFTERMKTALGIPTMILAVTLASCGSTETEAGESNEANESAKAASLFKVGVSNIAPQAFTHRFSVQGNVETDRNALLTTEFGGAIEEVMVREGQQVSEGTPLVRVNTDVMERSAAELQTQLELAQAVFERQERLWDQSIGSEIEFLQAKTQLEALQGSLKTLEEQMEMAVMRAPFPGVVDRCLAKTGEFAVPGAPLVRIVDLKDMYVRASVSDHYAGKVSKGMPAEVIVSGVDSIRTNVGRVGQFINPSNRTLEISLPLPDGSNFLPNMYASVWLQDLSLDSAMVLPSALVQQDINGDEFVFVAEGQGEVRTVRKTLIASGMGSGDNLLITSGLAFGDDVISRGANRVVEGQEVNLITD
jgi:RND family efflux transporter MFP subunit